MRSIRRGWPTAAIACSVPMSVGRVVEPERGHVRRRSRPTSRAPRGGPRRARRRGRRPASPTRRRRARPIAQRDRRRADLDHRRQTELTSALLVGELDRRRCARRRRRARRHARARAPHPCAAAAAARRPSLRRFVRSASATARSAGPALHPPRVRRLRARPRSPCSSGRSTTNGSASPSAARASSTSVPSRAEELVEPGAGHGRDRACPSNGSGARRRPCCRRRHAAGRAARAGSGASSSSSTRSCSSGVRPSTGARSHEDHQHARPLDVAQELVARARGPRPRPR